MRNFLFKFTLSCLLVSLSCDDGDIINVEFDFDDTFKACGESNVLFFKTKEDPTETLSVSINGFTIDDLFFVEAPTTKADSLKSLSGVKIFEETGTFTYRTYNRSNLPADADLFCNNVPPANLNITIDESSSCDITITRSFTEDDNDGIPFEFENPDPNEDGNFDDALDTDNDGIPNYIDGDDDGDNVPTSAENPDPNGDGNPDDAQDTDGDGIPDYLDDDDDNDLVPTRNEENITQDENPQNDVTNPDVGPDYLNPNVMDSVPARAFRTHTVNQTFSVTMVVENINLDFLFQQSLFFGELIGSGNPTVSSYLNQSRTITPDLP